MNQKITPFLWFDNNAEEAINLYTSIFKNHQLQPLPRRRARASRTTDDRHV
jgi:predicted 3-demethylubiquinone-9 3-methyltransferase (glyoxalase superfamily)